MSKSLCRPVSMDLVFQHPVLQDLSAAIGKLPTATQESLPEQLPRNPLKPTVFPASFGQQRMWVLQQMLPERSTYNVCVAWQFAKHDVPIQSDGRGVSVSVQIRAALQTLMNRHESLRTSFQYTENELQQIIHPVDSVTVQWRESNTSCNSVRQTLTKLARQDFDLEHVPLWRADYVTCEGNAPILLLNFHHSIIDEWSIRILSNQLATLMQCGGLCRENLSPIEPGSAGHSLTADGDNQAFEAADATAWERQQLTSEREAHLQDFWADQLSDLPDPINLPSDEPRPAQPSSSGHLAEFVLTNDTVERLRKIALEEQTTLFTTIISAWFVWLYRYSHQSDLITGTPVTTRNRTELHPIIGFLLNTVPVRAKLDQGMVFRDVVRQVKATLIEVWQNSDYPFQRIVERVVRERTSDHQSLLRTMFVLVEDGVPALQAGGLCGQPICVDTETAKADLTLFVLHEDDRWICRWEASADLFARNRSEQMNEHWLQLLNAAASSPDSDIARLNMVTREERQRVLIQWNQTNSTYPHDRCIHELFDDHVRKTPDASAIIWRDQTLSYGELNQRAETIRLRIGSLIQTTGPRIGICMSRSSDAVASMLGILKAGGIYVPLDPKLPADRLKLLIDNAGLTGLILTSDDLQAVEQTIEKMSPDNWSRTEAGFPGLWLFQRTSIIESDDVKNSGLCPADRPGLTAMSPAYMIFTSGTTGDPKGVLIPHRGVVRLVINNTYINLSASDRMLQLASLSFDASTFEIWGALLNGGCLVLMPTGQPSLDDIANVIQHCGVTVLLFTTGLFHLIVDEKPETLASLKTIVTGGDVLSPVHAHRAIAAYPQCKLVNAYGPTENSVITTTFCIEPDSHFSTVPIGDPIRNTTVYILDGNLEPVPVGVVGEIYTGGDGVGLGYFQDSQRTALRFVQDPFLEEINGFAEPRLMYRTGDYARLRSDGNLEFRGRTDGQVKVRGFRIELGEVE
ncbi:MAG: amino acid adenylation domain-containing protein, partial [Planctomyces sp.]|nr:amino acid adenylation domain-containing protein [Planctomyces sp.]